MFRSYRTEYQEIDMKMKSWFSLLAISLLCLFLQQAVADEAGFIENMPELKQDPDRAGASIWQKEGVDRSVYKKVMFAPVELFISPDSKYKGLDPDELKALTDGFIKTLTDTLAPEIQVVSEAGPDVLFVRVAMTNVKLANKKRGLLGYTPIGFVTTSVMNAAGARISLKDAELEFETLDSVSGERVGVLVDKMPTTEEEDKLSWDSISKSMEFYAQRFKARMQQAE
jgi:hypothetical protein